ncbi:holo-ACP synthase [Massilia endophytica]|uniref:holo-ACP synthase n=1 Tax=Massilia endophytica TaxID=2899220 RepID=UPI001E3D135B|nr:holo-ACP synthase [Massilia endophytica]UGQ44581.1 holo-ACP synthase [Massilia endophytica]
MIYGVGTDVCKIPRIEAALQRHGVRFAQRVLGPEELEEYHHRSARHAVRGVRYVATRFAAKEAFSKALGLGLTAPMTWQTAQMLNAPSGKPMMVCSGPLEQFMQQNRLTAQVSVSDEDDVAVAFVIVEKADD